MPGRYAIAGLGRMGTAICQRLRDCGHEVSAWNRGPDHPRIKGVRYVDRPAALVEGSEIVISSLYDQSAIEAVYLGQTGLLSASAPGVLFVDTSTVGPNVAALISSAAEKRGAEFVDGPVLGTVEPARTGQLVLLTGGAPAAAKRAAELLRPISKAQYYMGPPGAGYAAKLAVNVIMAGYWASLGDALAIATDNDLDHVTLLNVIGNSPAALAQFPMKRELLEGRDAPIGFTIDGCLKDISTARAAAKSKLPMVAALLEAITAASVGGWGNRDVAAIALHPAHRHTQGDKLA
jgi:3-hydroxyisobutyrate dehydrogenase